MAILKNAEGRIIEKEKQSKEKEISTLQWGFKQNMHLIGKLNIFLCACKAFLFSTKKN